ncbi:MAG: ribonuclease P protein component [Chloroflexi bacterium]|nr:ribonuclease P protein component [Chloroflexota bacterium]
MRSGRRARHPLLHVAVRCSDLPRTRFGFSVGRRVGSAVVRNRVKRRLRAIMRELPVRPGLDVVAIAQDAAGGASYAELRDAAAQCLRRARGLEGGAS